MLLHGPYGPGVERAPGAPSATWGAGASCPGAGCWRGAPDPCLFISWRRGSPYLARALLSCPNERRPSHLQTLRAGAARLRLRGLCVGLGRRGRQELSGKSSANRPAPDGLQVPGTHRLLGWGYPSLRMALWHLKQNVPPPTPSAPHCSSLRGGVFCVPSCLFCQGLGQGLGVPAEWL